MVPHDDRHRPLWKNFLRSIVLLTIAMMSALYSTSSARDGQVAQAATASLVALGIALWVGVRFVPRLARDVDWRWLPIFSHYKITRDGLIFLAALLVVVAAAINTANNLLYMVLSALLAVLTLSAILSAMNFRFLEMELRLPEHTFAGEVFPASVRIHNKKRLFPAFSLQPTPQDTPLYFTVVHPQTSVSDTCELQFSRRGRYIIKKLKTASRFPFGLFSKMLEYKVNAECICYPAIVPQEQLNLFVTDVQGSNARYERGLGYDLYTIRDYMPSDSARHVHWKASAKTASLKTREFAAEDTRRIVLAFDRFGSPRDAERFEKHVSHAASLAFHLVKSGADVVLISDEWNSPSGSTTPVLETILSYLAEVEMSESAPMPVTEGEGALMLSLRHNRARS